MARTSSVRQKNGTNNSTLKARPPLIKKGSSSKRSSSISNGKKTTKSIPKAKNNEAIDYYDIDFNGDARFKANYEKLFKRGVFATRYCDSDALKALHIEDDVHWLFSNIGWRDFLTIKYPTYKRATLEFLSSLKAVVEPGYDGRVTFRLYNQEHTWTLSKLNEVLGLPSGGPKLTSKYWTANQLWAILTNKNSFDSKGSPNALIRHPALRYVHKVLASTIFGREKNSKVRKDELYMLEHMLHARPIDTGAFLIRQMNSIVKKETTTGAIVLGGLITPIALYLGHKDRLIQDGSVEGSDSIDISACSSMGWIRKKEGTTLWCLGIDDEEELPSSEVMTLRIKDNWSFNVIQPHIRASSLLSEPSIPPSPTAIAISSSLPSPPTTSEDSSPTPIEIKLNYLMASVDNIKNEQKEIKEQLTSISKFLGTLSTWIQSGGSKNLPCFSLQ